MRRPCFTLIEMVAVIATIALLMAVLLPALRRSRAQAKAVICSSNIKQLLLGLLNYENENRTLPYSFYRDFSFQASTPPGGYAGNSAYDKRGWWWFNFIEGYYIKSDRKETVICCPSKRLNHPVFKKDVLFFSKKGTPPGTIAESRAPAIEKGYCKRKKTVISQAGEEIDIDLCFAPLMDNQSRITGFLGLAKHATLREERSLPVNN